MIKLNNAIVQIGKYPNGEIYVDIPNNAIRQYNQITLKHETSDDILGAYFLMRELKDTHKNTISLYCPYLPYSRADRRESNRAFSLEHFASIVNDNVGSVLTLEVHNPEVSSKLFKNLVNMDFSMLYYEYEMPYNDAEILVFPDKGAMNRYKSYIDKNKLIVPYVHFEKERDFETGKIKSIKLSSECTLENFKKAVIIDDICSKGGTFIPIIQTLRENGIETVELVVAHTELNIFNGELLSHVDKVHTTNSIIDETQIPEGFEDKFVIKNVMKDSFYEKF